MANGEIKNALISQGMSLYTGQESRVTDLSFDFFNLCGITSVTVYLFGIRSSTIINSSCRSSDRSVMVFQSRSRYIRVNSRGRQPTSCCSGLWIRSPRASSGDRTAGWFSRPERKDRLWSLFRSNPVVHPHISTSRSGLNSVPALPLPSFRSPPRFVCGRWRWSCCRRRHGRSCPPSTTALDHWWHYWE